MEICRTKAGLNYCVYFSTVVTSRTCANVFCSSIGYTIVVAIATIIFLTISVSFFKAVYPAPAPFRSSFNALKASAKATIICNFLSSFLWCTALGIQAREIWASLSHEKDDDNTDISGVESDGRFWVRVGITAGVMLGSLALGWFSLQGVWRNKHCLNFTAPSTELPSLSCSDR